MKIEFESSKHEKLVNNIEALRKKFNKTRGVDTAIDIIEALNILNAAESMVDIPNSFRPHPLQGSFKGCFAIDVDKKNRIIFKPNHPNDINFRIDNYSSIKNIIIIEIYKDYHK